MNVEAAEILFGRFTPEPLQAFRHCLAYMEIDSDDETEREDYARAVKSIAHIAALLAQRDELLAALEAIMNDCESFINDEDGPNAIETCQSMRECARAAIANATKAEGGQS